MPASIQSAVTHHEFETIHPFLDGNGRVGRLLVPLMLHQGEVMAKPLPYISHYLKAKRHEYYDRLMDVRVNGNWEGRVKFFFTGVAAVGHEAGNTIKRIVQFCTKAQQTVVRTEKPEFALIDYLFKHPVMDTRTEEKLLGVTYAIANNALSNIEMPGLLLRLPTGNAIECSGFKDTCSSSTIYQSATQAIHDSEKPTRYQHGTDKPVEQEL